MLHPTSSPRKKRIDLAIFVKQEIQIHFRGYLNNGKFKIIYARILTYIRRYYTRSLLEMCFAVLLDILFPNETGFKFILLIFWDELLW